MHATNHLPGTPRRATSNLCAAVRATLLAAIAALGSTFGGSSHAAAPCAAPGCAGTPYSNMSEIAPIGPRTGKYMDVPESAKGPAIDPAKGYRIQPLGKDLYMVTENVYQAMFLVYDRGVVVVDAPPSIAALIPKAIAEVTDKPITHLIYSHSHSDHIGGARSIGRSLDHHCPRRNETRLERARDANRPLPTRTFGDHYTLNVGHANARAVLSRQRPRARQHLHLRPAQRTLMVVDVVFPGWMPLRRARLAQDIPGYFAQVEEIKSIAFRHLGHRPRRSHWHQGRRRAAKPVHQRL